LKERKINIPHTKPNQYDPRFFFSDNFALHYPDLLDNIDFPVVIKLNKGFDIDMFLFKLVPRTFGSRQ
jgi:hypothetical protein